MATSLEPKSRASRQYVDFDEYIDFQLSKTRSNIKWNDIVTAGVTVAAFAVGYLLCFAVLDHWVVPGGFGETARLLLASALGAVCLAWLIWKIVVPYLRRVSALYAARAIETAEPGLKSTLLNLVDLGRSGRPIPPGIRATLEKRTARTLSEMDVDQAVDRRSLMRVSYILLALVVLTCLYAIVSPKKISFARAFVPAARIAPSTRTRIVDVRTNPPFIGPRENELLWRTQLEVTVDLQGERPDEVTLFYTTEDRKFVDQPVRMQQVEEGLMQYRGVLNGENGRGLLQDVSWYVVAGDAVSDRYTITVIQPPSISIETVRYEYPEYMELEPKTEPGSHVDAWEGTTVTLEASVNKPVSSALLQFFDTPDTSVRAEEMRMEILGRRKLRATWTLEFRADGTCPRHYRIAVKTEEGHSDPRPALHDLTIRPDRPPVVELLDPRTDLEVPANAVVPLFFEAHDPDFKLRYITLRAKKNGQVLPRSPQLFEGLQKEYKDTWDWRLEPLDLQPGDVLAYWLEARDNQEPLGNLSRQRQVLELRIVDSVSEDEADRRLKQDHERIRNRLQEDQQEGNDQGRPELPPQQPAGEENAEKGQSHQPEKQDQKEPQDGGSSDEPSKKQGQQPSDQQQEDSSGQDKGEGSQQEKIDPSGAEDLEALRRLLEKQQQEKQSGSGENQPQDDQPQKQPDPKKDDGRSPQPQEKPGNRPQDESKQREPKESEPTQNDSQQNKSNQNTPNENESKKNGQPESKDDPSKDGGSGAAPEDGSQPDPKDKSSQSQKGAGGQGDGSKSEAGPDQAPSQQSPDGGQDGSSKADSPKNGEKPGQDSKSKNRSGDVTDGRETPAEESKDAQQRKADGDEKGPATPAEDPNVESTPAKNKIERKKGRKPTTRPHKGDQDVKPQDRASDNPGSTNPNRAKPAPRTKKDEQQSDTPDPTRSTPQPTAPDETTARQDKQPDAANEENKGKGRPEGQTSDSPQGGEEGLGKPNDQGKSGSNKPGAGDSSGNPGRQEQAGGEKTGQPGQQQGPGSTKRPSETQDGQSKSGGGSDPGGSKKGEGQTAGQSRQNGGQQGKQTGEGGGSRAGQPKVGGGGARGGPSAGPAGEGDGSGAIPQEEKANLEYNKKAANLVLKKLQEDVENGNVDPELLKEFGWTENQFKEFAQRLQNRLNQKGQNLPPREAARQQQLQEFLKGFNLRRGGAGRDRASPNVAPRRRPVPPEFRDYYEAYTRSLSRKKSEPDSD